MSPYRPNRPPTRVDLSDNTSLWGPPPAAREAIASIGDARLSRYPTPYADELVEAIARHHGLALEQVTTGCGSDDVLDSAIRACTDAGGSLATPVPTFSVIPDFAAVNEVDLKSVAVHEDATVDVRTLLATRADCYYVCSPNNPTGVAVGLEQLDELCAGTEAVVLVDEAYADFAEGSALSLVGAHANLVVVRTLSKAYGLAGLRVGYAIGDPAVVAAITASRGPYKVGTLAEAVAVAALRDGTGWVRERVAEVRTLRADFTSRLRGAGFRVLDSEANFVAVLVDDARGVFDAMLAREVLVRAYADLEVLGDLVRITIGPAALLDEAYDALVAATS